jgi:uncharacterized protein
MKAVVVLLAVLLLVWLVLGSVRRRGERVRRPEPPVAPPIEGMVVCAHCGVHLPVSLALANDGAVYCSPAHRDAGPRNP